MRFWEDIRSCGPQQFAQSQLGGIAWDDPIVKLVAYESFCYLALTQSGNQMFNVYVTMKGGVPVIQHRPITKPLNIFGRVSEWIAGASGSSAAASAQNNREAQQVIGISVGGKIKTAQPSLVGAPKEIFIATRSQISCWSVGTDRPEKVLFYSPIY